MHSSWIIIALLLLVSSCCDGAFAPAKPFVARKAAAMESSSLLMAKDDKDDNQIGNFFFGTGTKEKSKNGSTTTEPKGDIVKSEFYLEILEAVWSVGSEIAIEAFFFLRKTAANALTASLPEDERQELLERTMGRQKVSAARKKANQEYAESMSVQENVAAAVAKERQRGDRKQWEKEKAEIYKQAEKAAKERVETELAIQRQRMEKEKQQMNQKATAAQQQLNAEKESLQALQAEIVKEKEAVLVQQQVEVQDVAAAVEEAKVKLAAMEGALQQKEEQAKLDQQKIEQLEQKLKTQAPATATATPPSTADLPRIRTGRYTAEQWRSLSNEEKEEVNALREKEGFGPDGDVAAEEDVHPILGPVVQDLGYKRVHIMSAGKLGTIPIWKKQRIYRHERAKAMVDDKWKSMDLGLPGVICLHEDEETGKLAIIDGQHRVGMMMLLRDKQRRELQDNPNPGFNVIDFDRVLVEVYPSDKDVDQHAQDLFLEINKAEPVKLIDMPGVASASDRKIITEAVDKLYETYPAMFSPSQRCRVPNVNVDNLRNSLFGSGCTKTHKLTTAKKLYDWILDQNAMIGDKYIDSLEEQGNVAPKAWKKARENKFYLGLESSWLFN